MNHKFPTISREQQLTDWVQQQLPKSASSATSITLNPIASDAGFRRYFRFASPSKWLAVDAPPITEDSSQFALLARYLSSYKVATPYIYAMDEQQGFLLVEDFGDGLLHNQLSPNSVDRLYHQAMQTLQMLQRCPDDHTIIPRYDQALLRRELLIFNEWFVNQLLGHTLQPNETALLEQLFELLETSALTQPQTLVHRDFHSRNLLIRSDNSLGVIDFQGALWGACTYDLASLLRDCYIRWPAINIKNWALTYRQQAIKEGLLDNVSETTFLQWFDFIGLQRHIKVLGIFARLHLRDGKTHYLHDLPLVIRYTLEVSEQYPALQAFANWFKATLLPLAESQHHWYKDYRHAGECQ